MEVSIGEWGVHMVGEAEGNDRKRDERERNKKIVEREGATGRQRRRGHREEQRESAKVSIPQLQKGSLFGCK